MRIHMMAASDMRLRNSPNAGLRHWWKFQTDFMDSVGGQNGVPTASVTLGTKLGRKAMRLPGVVNNWLSLPELTIGEGPWSVSTWYCPENLAGYQHLLTSVDNTEFMFKIARVGDPQAGKPYVYAKTGLPAGSKFATVTVPVNSWTHLAVTFEDGSLKFYVNGVLRGVVAATMNIASKTYRIGNGGGTGEYSNGWQADLRIYDKAITLSEVQNLFANT